MKRKELPLPGTRKEQFKYIVFHRKMDLFIMSLYLTLFSLPIFLWLIFTNYAPLFKASNIFNILVVYGVMVIFFPLVGLAVGGVSYSLRRMLLGEGSSIKHDFFTGIKITFKPFSLIFLIFGVMNLFIHLSLFCLLDFKMNQILCFSLIAMIYFVAFIVVIVLSYYLSQSLLYSCTFSQFMVTSFRFMAGKFIVNLGIFFLILLPYFLIDFIPLMSIITIGILLLGYSGFVLFLFIIYSFYLFDEYINKDLYQEYYHMGLTSHEDN